jgi:hypothetical protein
MKVMHLKRYFAEQGSTTCEFAIRRVREAGYIQAGRPGYGGAYSLSLEPIDIARILAAAVHPRGPKYGVRDFEHAALGALDGMAEIIAGRAIVRHVDVWRFEDDLGASTTTTIPPNVLHEIRALYLAETPAQAA